MYDVVIIGARCAGSALALMLARDGLNVLAIDRTTFPSDTMSGHFIHPAGVSCLRRLGLLENLDGARRSRAGDDDGGLRTGRPPGPPAPAADGTRSAMRRAASFRPDARGGRRRGRRGSARGRQLHGAARRGRPRGRHPNRDAARAAEDIGARLVVGADGKRSRFARGCGRTTYGRQPAATCSYYAYWAGFDAPRHAAVRARRAVLRRHTHE